MPTRRRPRPLHLLIASLGGGPLRLALGTLQAQAVRLLLDPVDHGPSLVQRGSVTREPGAGSRERAQVVPYLGEGLGRGGAGLGRLDGALLPALHLGLCLLRRQRQGARVALRFEATGLDRLQPFAVDEVSLLELLGALPHLLPATLPGLELTLQLAHLGERRQPGTSLEAAPELSQPTPQRGGLFCRCGLFPQRFDSR